MLHTTAATYCVKVLQFIGHFYHWGALVSVPIFSNQLLVHAGSFPYMGSWDYEVELGPKTGAMHILYCHNTAHAEFNTLIYCTIVLFSLPWQSFICAFSNE